MLRLLIAGLGGSFLYAKAQTPRFEQYGIFDGRMGDLQIYTYITMVTTVLGNGKFNNADALIEETIRAETLLGYAKDHSTAYGEGLGQFDRIAFDDVKARCPENLKTRLKTIGVFIDSLDYDELRCKPLAAIAMISLKYIIIK